MPNPRVIAVSKGAPAPASAPTPINYPPAPGIAEFRPGEPTSHKVQDCRIKQSFLSTTCDVCGQKGHPSRFCQSGKAGRANQADEDNKSIASTRSKRSTTLKRYVERADDELNAAEAMKALKAAHKRNKRKGKKSLFTITRVDLSSSDSE